MISVIIPSYNSELTIGNCLSALTNQSYSGDYEILLVDSSVDRTPEIVREKFPEVRLVHFNQKTDPGSARNEGVRQAEGDLLLFIDSDCVPEIDWIEKHVRGHRQYPDVPGIGGSVENGNRASDIAARAGYIAEFREFIPEQNESFVSHLPTLNISYKKWVFEKYGLFDPHFYPQEDLEFNYRLTGGKNLLYFVPQIKVRHYHRSDMRSFFNHQKQIGRITSQVLKVLPLPGSAIVRNRLLFIIFGLALPPIKFVRTLIVFLRANPSLVIRHPESFVLLKIGLIFWYWGFWKGVFMPPLQFSNVVLAK